MMASRQLGKYALLEELGHGGFGTVYQAQDTVLDVERAVKVLHPALTSDPEFVERFRREARLAAKLERPNIVPVYDLDEQDGHYFLAMRYMPGGSLKTLLDKEGALPFERALGILKQVAAGLDYAHAHGLIHRDIKPQNILFDRDPLAGTGGNASISDLGFAKVLAASGESGSLSRSSGMLGTPAYISPEAWDGEGWTPAADVYSLGCVFYEMLTGKVLFSGETPSKLMKQHIIEGPSFPVIWPEGVPDGIASVLEKALAKEPGERYASARAFAAGLEGLLAVGGKKEPQEKFAEEPLADRLRIAEKASREEVVGRSDLVGRDKNPLYAAESKKHPWWPWAVGVGGLLIVAIIIIAVLVLPGLVARPVHMVTNSPTPASGSTQISLKDGMVMVYVPAGEFLMGSNDSDTMAQSDEKPQHAVSLGAFWIDRTEITNAMYTQCVQASICQPPGESSSYTRANYYDNVQFADYPVIFVDWTDANMYCGWAGRRLPTEAEWEKAARGTDGWIYPWGNSAPNSSLANFNMNVSDTTAVGDHPSGASPYGAFDMAGNVWEWVHDWYGSYSQSPQSNPQGPATGTFRVLRGGAWGNNASNIRSADRDRNNPDTKSNGFGFRCALSSL